MFILERKLSDKCAQIAKSTLESLSVNVIFKDITEIGRNAYGSTDITHYEDGYCVVYLDLNQSLIQFETTLLHELHHVWQKSCNYPLLNNKVASAAFQTDELFFKQLGSQIQSSILDLDVIHYLQNHGYSSAIFSDVTEDDCSCIFKNVTDQSLKDSANLAAAVLHLYVAYIRAEEADRPKILDSAHQFPQIIEEVDLLMKTICPEQCSDPSYCAYAIGWIVDHFSLWKYYCIDFRGERIRTHGEYEKYFG